MDAATLPVLLCERSYLTRDAVSLLLGAMDRTTLVALDLTTADALAATRRVAFAVLPLLDADAEIRPVAGARKRWLGDLRDQRLLTGLDVAITVRTTSGSRTPIVLATSLPITDEDLRDHLAGPVVVVRRPLATAEMIRVLSGFAPARSSRPSLR